MDTFINITNIGKNLTANLAEFKHLWSDKEQAQNCKLNKIKSIT